jgi:hypothetical protein
MDAELRRLAEAHRELAGIVERLQFELQGHVRDMVRPVGDFYAIVMDPNGGAIVRLRAVEEAVKRLEDDMEAARERRRWVARDLVGVGIMLVATSLLSAILTAYFLGK